MSLAKKFLNAITAAEDDIESIVEIRDYYLKNHAKNNYSDDKLDIIFFKDNSIMRANRISPCNAEITIVLPENALEFMNELANEYNFDLNEE